VVPDRRSPQTAPPVLRTAVQGIGAVVTHETSPDPANNLAAEIARLTRLGLDRAEIADRLGIPVERVADSSSGMTDSSPGGLGRRDQTSADSFPASDPPPGPGA
jgi:hypothetical protein